MCSAWMLHSTLSSGLSKRREVCSVLADMPPHSDPQRQVNMDYLFANALTHNMDNIGRISVSLISTAPT